MNSAETLIIWFLVGTFAFFMVGLSWTAGSFFDLVKKRDPEETSPEADEHLTAENDEEEEKKQFAQPELDHDKVHRSLIARYDLIEDMMGVAEKNGEDNMIEQVDILKKDYLSLMEEFSLYPFEFEVGDKIALDDRRKILLVDQVDGSNEVSESIAVGFNYLPEDADVAQVVRKAAVKLG